LQRIRETLVATGVDEALTLSVVEPAISDAFSPWTDAPALRLSMPILRRADRLRQSLVPSLLVARRTNETLDNPRIELFETARAYWGQPSGLPREELLLAIASSRDFASVKGILEAIVERLNPASALEVKEFRHELFSPGRACELRIGDERLGYLAEIGPEGRKRFELRGPATVAEVRVSVLERIAQPIPQAVELSPYPAVERDLNLVVAEAIRWADVSATIRAAAGADLERLSYQDTYRDPQRLGTGRKSLLLTLTLRGADRTLSGVEADQVRNAVVAACAKSHGATLRA
jgi:phenylalanyl-tRNA synthetase beta chain